MIHSEAPIRAGVDAAEALPGVGPGGDRPRASCIGTYRPRQGCWTKARASLKGVLAVSLRLPMQLLLTFPSTVAACFHAAGHPLSVRPPWPRLPHMAAPLRNTDRCRDTHERRDALSRTPCLADLASSPQTFWGWPTGARPRGQHLLLACYL